MSSSSKPKPKEEIIHTHKSIAAGNNDRVANVVFTIMTGFVMFFSTYLYFYLQEYLDLIKSKYPNYDFPKYSDYIISVIFIPITTVIIITNFIASERTYQQILPPTGRLHTR
jgi:hypothetical protein